MIFIEKFSHVNTSISREIIIKFFAAADFMPFIDIVKEKRHPLF